MSDTALERTIHVELHLQLDRRPISGRLRYDGAELAFVGWLGLVEALREAQRLSLHPQPQGAAMSEQTQAPILVIGATGKTGRRVLERLTAREIPVRAGSRGAQPPFDWEDPATWPAALDGARAAYIAYYPDLALPGAVETVGALARAAVERDVRRLVLLAGHGEPEAEEAEEAARASGADLTVVRAAWFAQNFSEDYMIEGILGGTLALPAGSVTEPFVDAEDIADVAVAALTQDGHAGETYHVTGPRLLTFAEAVGEIAAAAGRPVAYEQVPVEAFAADALAGGVPEPIVTLLRYLFGEVLDGRNSHVGDGVQRAIGRPARDFTQYARDTAASGVWTVDRHATA